jgi:signal transduction histidine kinase
VLIGCGLLALDRAASATGALIAATGFAWFLPGFSVIDIAPIAWIAGHALYLHRGPLVQAILSFPTGRLDRAPERLVVAAAYVVSLIEPAAASLAAQAILGVAVIATAAWRGTTAVGAMRRARAWAIPAATAIGLALIALAIVKSWLPDSQLELLGYEAVLCGVAAWLTAGLLREPWARPEVTDFVVELGDAPTGSVRDALARELGDPTLEVAFAAPGGDGFVDSAGRPVALSPAGEDRAVTPIDSGGRRVGVIIHDPAVLDDPALVQAVAEAAQLASMNARLQAEARAQIDEVAASRRRLLAAEEEERRRIAGRLDEGAGARLRSVADALAAAHARLLQNGDEAARARVEHAILQLERTRDDLRVLARGLVPTELDRTDLQAAVAELAAGAPLPIDVSGSTGELPSPVAAAAYFVCSEAVANIVKHANASRASITFGRQDGDLVIEIVDDGIGGADPGSGSGLRGLRDRLDGLSGRLIIDSRPDAGTCLTAEIPLGGEGDRPSGVTRSS